MKGLAPLAGSVIEAISQLDCIKPYVLVGGTALAMQLGNRMSEDLDFMSWRTSRSEKREVNWPEIKRQFESIGKVENFDILDIDHIEFRVNGVKVSFYANPNYSPLKQAVTYLNNIRLADLHSIGAIKMEVMLRCSKFRDYYDIYSLIEAGLDLQSMMSVALQYSNHRLKSKNLLAMLTNSDRFIEEDCFAALNPVYSVTAKDIEQRIVAELKKN